MIELLMFDADGVLFESYQSNIAYYNAIFAQLGEPPLDHDEEIKSISYAAADVFALRARGNAALLARMKEIARGIDQVPFFELLRPHNELRAFMLALKKNYRLGLATNRSATVPGLVKHLELDDIFDAIASALDRVPPKPAPDILNLCLERARVHAHNAVYIGDSPIDREAAEAAGVRFIGVGPRVDHHHRIAGLGELTHALERVALEVSAASGMRRATGSTR
jgi:HAD superfamily hydrolase (TIGR01509 family)